MGSVLYAREVPSVGGDTVFVDMHAAYEGLPDKMKAEIAGRTAEHDWAGFRYLLQGANTWTPEQI